MKFPRKQNSQAGVVMLEAAVLLPIFLLLLVGFIDCARILGVQSQLTVASEQALTVASTDPGLDAYSFEAAAKAEPQPVEFTSAEDRILERARRVAHSGGIEASAVVVDQNALVIPRYAPKPGALMEQVLESTPIEIRLAASYDPILPFIPPLEVVGRAIGFREPRKMANMPLVVDCNGNTLGSPNYENQPCPCPVEKMWDFNKLKCVCRNNPANDGECTCAANMQMNANFTGCVCKDYPCTGNFVKNANNTICSCVCPINGANAQCECVSPRTRQGNSCSCPPAPSLPPNTIYNQTSCSVQCRETFVPIGGDVNNGCECPGNTVLTNTPSGPRCACDHSTCNPDQKRAGASCSTCMCGTNTASPGATGVACSCINNNYVLNPQTRDCQCAAHETCPVIGQRRGAGCSCVCPTNSTSNGSSCSCNDPNRKLVVTATSSSCVCKSAAEVAPCPGGKVWNTSSCSCVCPGNKVDQGGICGCQGNMTDPENDGTCTCPNPPPANGFLSTPDCSPTCPTGRTQFNNQCVYQECAVGHCSAYIQADGSCKNCPER